MRPIPPLSCRRCGFELRPEAYLLNDLCRPCDALRAVESPRRRRRVEQAELLDDILTNLK